jgi:dCTP deaminase
LRDGVLVPVTVDLKGSGPGAIVGYRAKKNANRIDVDRINHYDPREFWEKIESKIGRLNLDAGDFYILATREDVGVPPQTAAEMVPYDTRSGEFRVHYAGVFRSRIWVVRWESRGEQGGLGSSLLRRLIHIGARADRGMAAICANR